jgi:hypothetical protein
MTDTAYPHVPRPTPATGAAADRSLRLWLNADALASGALGLFSIAGCTVLDGPLGISTAALASLGVVLVVWAAALRRVVTRPVLNRPAAWVIVAINALWVLDSIAVVALGWFALTSLGVTMVLLQAGAVVVLLTMQGRALRA